MSGTPWMDMERGVWEWLSRFPEYQALELHEYRGYNGDIVPFDPENHQVFPGAALPCISSVISDMSAARVAAGWQDTIALRLSLVYQAGMNDGDRGVVEEAASTIRDILTSREAETQKLGAPSAITEVRLQPVRLVPWTGPGESRIRYWEWQFTLKLVGKRRT